MPLTAITRQLSLSLSPQDAFETFFTLNNWWPKEYTWSKDVLAEINIEPKIGGFCYEKSQAGLVLAWGTVIEWKPNQRLAFLWQIGPSSVPEPNPDKASIVQIDFLAQESQTIIQLNHKNFERHGEGAAAFREAMDSPYGWTYLLSCYEKKVRIAC